MLTLLINLTEEDLINFNYLHWSSPENSSYRLQYFLRTFIFGCFGASILVFFKVAYGDKVNLQDLLIILSWGFLVAIIFTFLLLKNNIKRHVAKMIADPRNVNMLSKSELVVSSLGIESTDAVSKLSFKWTAITKSRESKYYFLFYVNSYHAIIVPKRLLSDSELKILNQILIENITLSIQLNEL